jgi:hypothetical protein
MDDLENNENEEYDTSESDYLTQEEGTSLHNWDESIDPNTVNDWVSEEDRRQAVDYYAEMNPEPWDGRSAPDESQFDTYEQYQDAKIKHRVDQELAGLVPAIPPPIDDPRERDDYFIDKSQIINRITEYREKEASALAAGDPGRARECRQLAESFEKDFHKLESEHPDPTFKENFEGGLAMYKQDLDNAVENPDDFERRRAAGDDAQFYKDCQQRVKSVNAASSDDTLYFLMGDSQHGRRPDYYVAKVDLPPGQKEKIMRESEFKGTLYDQLVRYNYAEPMAPPVVDDNNLDSANPGDMTQEQYEKWRESHGAKPKYHPLI